MDNYDLFKSILTTIPEDSRNVSFAGFALLMVISIIMAILVSQLYVKFFDAHATGSRIHRSFPLLGPAITAIFITVQFSLPLSLGLLGALSIVRFRTPIKEPEEIGFILLVVACSITIATFNVAFAVILYLSVLLMLFFLRFLPGFKDSQAEASILNILVDNGGEVSVNAALDVSMKLTEHRINHVVSSVHMDEEKTNISITIRRHTDNDLAFIQSLIRSFPDLQIDYYRRM
ncbi:DUF4956 domain-containing protein [Desulfofustis glycolicus]|uniref:DUF4956 domain-containing protein n=1 Tax=Desulfofustis glycolicus DSM 9705 TaxID=1121409 RepID=A0A1M5UW60_9BACT|nr:DUF4956 domain-containing protein [Desulfofustis glycolicus]MCB2215890.1 DUF4956 domain-containing protein [Desulfobulbaceae bacterium]SHH67150.1 protein of unknown function [Desulfofustis glycolicus DSM 9705]